MVNAVIFDNDGVLVDTEHLFYASCRDTLKGAGVELSLDVYQDISLRQGKSCMHLALSVGYDESGVQQLRLDRDVLYRELLLSSLVVPDGVYETLEALHGNVKMGVVTSTTREHFELIHKQTGIPDYLDFVYTQEDMPRLKPYPDPYLLALKRQSLDAETSLVVEDTERGLQAALAAGIRCVVVPTEVSRGCEFKGALKVAESVKEILEFVDSK